MTGHHTATPRMSREEVVDYATRYLGFTHYVSAAGLVPLAEFEPGPVPSGWRYRIHFDPYGNASILDAPEKLPSDPAALRAFPLRGEGRLEGIGQ